MSLSERARDRLELATAGVATVAVLAAGALSIKMSNEVDHVGPPPASPYAAAQAKIVTAVEGAIVQPLASEMIGFVRHSVGAQ